MLLTDQISAAVTMAIAWAAAALAPPAVIVNGCPPGLLGSVAPTTDAPGPLQLEHVSCVEFSSTPFSSSDPIVSPDGTKAALWHAGSPAAIEAVRIANGAKLFEHPNRVTFRHFGTWGSLFDNEAATLAWSRDSNSLLTVRQDTAQPGGFALGGLVPIRIGLDGTEQRLGTLKHRTGPLDGIQWIGGNGLALAQFGTRGNQYRPEHPDASPTFAIVDATHGRVRDSFGADEVPRLRSRDGPVTIAGATAAILPDGRVRAIIRFNGRVEVRRDADGVLRADPIRHPGFRLLWTEGEVPRVWPFGDEGDGRQTAMLTPDGAQLLAIHGLQPTGIQTFDCRGCPPDPPPTPVTGPIAELTDVRSGRVLWRLEARATQFWNQRAAPAISPNGRYALVEIPPEAGRVMVALVSMKDGKIRQRFSGVHVGSYKQAFGFTEGGKRVWLTSGNIVFRYRLRESPGKKAPGPGDYSRTGSR